MGGGFLMGAPKTDFTVRDCQHGGRHRHGTGTAYRLDRCRCRPCTSAVVEASGRRRRMVAYGQWEPFVDAEPVRRHVRSLIDEHGVSILTIADRAGVAEQVIRRLLYVIAPRTSRSHRLRAANAAALLGVTGGNVRSTFAPACGTERRLRALVANGWSQTDLARRLDLSSQRVHNLVMGGRTKVRRNLHDQVAALYDELWNTPGGSAHSERIAARHGWALPIEWDDDRIDDPKARPYMSYRRSA